MRYFLLLFSAFIIFSSNSYAILQAPKASKREKEDTVLKADRVNADRANNIVNAYGNVEIKNNNITAYSDKIKYNQNNGWIKAYGNIKIKDLEVGNLYSERADIKDDFSQSKFPEGGLIVFQDGSYLESKDIERKNENITILKKSIFAICPDDEIAKNNQEATRKLDAISIKSSQTTIDREKRRIKTKHGIVRIYNFPIFYTPYLSLPMKSAKRESGFLTPSYVNNSQFGLGIKTPYFIAAAPNTDIIVTPTLYNDSDQRIVKTKIHQLVKYGEHETSLELANNEIDIQTDRQVIKRTDKDYRYDFRSNGKYIFTENSSLDHKIHTLGDRNYMRDYNFDFNVFTTSEVNYSYNKNRDYLGVSSVRFQELESSRDPKSAQFVLPSITHYTETKKPIFYKEKYAIKSNITAINRQSGMQYRRFSTTPEINIPLNFYGNLVDLNTKVQWDYYSIENNYRFNENQATRSQTDFDKSQTDYKPEFSAMWRLPLIQKLKSNTLMLEPMVNFVSSSVKKRSGETPNEDSNSTELTVNNLFISDRIAGYDRNETGERMNYGVKSAMFNKLGQFELTIGQSYRISSGEQDVAIRGFQDNNKSNFVGQFSYKLPKYLTVNYLFQLNESNYDNEVNSLITTLTLKKFFLNNDYLLIKEGVTDQERREQTTFSAGYKFTPKLTGKISAVRNLVSGKILTRSASIEYGGCCVIFKFMTTENNTDNLTETQRSHSINLTIRGL